MLDPTQQYITSTLIDQIYSKYVINVDRNRDTLKFYYVIPLTACEVLS